MKTHDEQPHRFPCPKPTQPFRSPIWIFVTLIFCSCFVFLTKKGESERFCFSLAYFFLSNSSKTAATAAMAATTVAIDIGKKYCSAIDAGACVGSGASSDASSTMKEVTALDAK